MKIEVQDNAKFESLDALECRGEPSQALLARLRRAKSVRDALNLNREGGVAGGSSEPAAASDL